MRPSTADRLFRVGAWGTGVAGVLSVMPVLTWFLGPVPTWLRAVLVVALLAFMALAALGWDLRRRDRER